MIGYAIAGPVIALLLSLKFTDACVGKQQKEYDRLVERIVLLEEHNEAADNVMRQKVMTLVMPLAKAVNKLNQEVGL